MSDHIGAHTRGYEHNGAMIEKIFIGKKNKIHIHNYCVRSRCRIRFKYEHELVTFKVTLKKNTN